MHYFVLLLTLALPVAAMAQKSARKPTKRSRRFINLPNRPVQAPFSDAVQIGDTLYLAGRIGVDPKTGNPPAEIEQEVHLVLGGMKETLAQADMDMDDLVYVQVFCPDLSLYEKFNAVYRTYFQKDFPARAFLGSGPLLRGGHFEIMAIAAKK